MVRNPSAVLEIQVWSLSQEDPLEKGMATHSSIFAWRNSMDRGAWYATIHGVTKRVTTELLTLSLFIYQIRPFTDLRQFELHINEVIHILAFFCNSAAVHTVCRSDTQVIFSRGGHKGVKPHNFTPWSPEKEKATVLVAPPQSRGTALLAAPVNTALWSIDLIIPELKSAAQSMEFTTWFKQCGFSEPEAQKKPGMILHRLAIGKSRYCWWEFSGG